MDEMHNYTKQEPDCLNSSAGVLTLRAIASLWKYPTAEC